TSTRNRSEPGTAGAGKRIEHRIARKTEHPDKSLGHFNRVWSRVTVAETGAPYVTPHGAHPSVHFVRQQHRECLLHHVGRAISTGLAQHQNVLVVVFDDRARLIGLAVKATRSAARFVRSIADLEPKDRRQVIKPRRSAAHLDVRRQRQYEMSPPSLAGHQHITDYAANATSRYQDAGTLFPDLVQFREKLLVVVDAAELCARRIRFIGF